jgi:hypothetical protein
MVRRRTGLHADQACWQLLEEGDHLAAPQLLAHNDFAGLVNAVDLENALRDIQSDYANILHGRLLC